MQDWCMTFLSWPHTTLHYPLVATTEGISLMPYKPCCIPERTSVEQMLHTGFPGGPGNPRLPGGPMRTLLLIGQPLAHLDRMEAACCDICAVTTPRHNS